MKKVLISAYTCCPNRGSEPGNGWNWVVGYVNTNYKVDCVTSSKYKTEICNYLTESKISNISFIFTDNILSLKLLKLPIIGIYLHYYYWLINARKIILEKVKSLGFSHCHHVTYSSIKFGTPLYDLPIKTIIGPLGSGALADKSLRKYYGIYYVSEYLKTLIGTVLSKINKTVRKSIESADLLIISNETIKKFIDQYKYKQILQMFDAGIADYFDVQYFERNLDQQINILWVGRILPRKGLNLAIEAISYLPKNLKFHFTIVGTGSQLKRCNKLVNQLGLREKVTFTGAIPHQSVVEKYRDSHVFLFPSLSDSCPAQVFEAMAMGLPVVTLNHQGMADQVSEGAGVKVPVGRGINYPRCLAQGILDVIKEEKKYNRYSETAYKQGSKQVMSKKTKLFISEYFKDLCVTNY